MGQRLKFYGWGREGEGLDEDERSRVFRFAAEKLSVEQSAAAAPPQAAEIALRTPRISAPASLASVLTQDPHERLLHTYGKSYPETVRAFARDFANAPDYVALPETEADIAAVFDWASGAGAGMRGARSVISDACGGAAARGSAPSLSATKRETRSRSASSSPSPSCPQP